MCLVSLGKNLMKKSVKKEHNFRFLEDTILRNFERKDGN